MLERERPAEVDPAPAPLTVPAGGGVSPQELLAELLAGMVPGDAARLADLLTRLAA